MMSNNTPTQRLTSHLESFNSDAFDQNVWREQFILTTLRIACVLGVALILVSFPTATETDRVLFIGLYILLLAITLLKTPYTIRAFSLLIVVFIVGTNSILNWGPWLDGSIFFIAFTVLSTLLFDQRVDIFALSISIGTVSLIAILHQLGVYQLGSENAPVTTLIDWVAYILDFSIVAIVLALTVGQFKKAFTRVLQEIQTAFGKLTTESEQLEEKIRERTEELELQATKLRSSASVARTIAEMQEVSELMDTTTKLTSEKFGYYHVGLYLLDERKRTAFLQATSSDIGKELIGQSFRIEPDRLNIFNVVTTQRRSHIILETDTNFSPDVNFPQTRARMMIPLTVRGNVIGLIDFHSNQLQIFNLQDIEVLQTLADMIAISLDNVRLINETKSLVLQLEATSSLQTRETWTKLTSRRKPAYQFTPAGVRPLFSAIKTEDQNGLQVPLILHGQNIGGILLKRKGNAETWSQRERILVQKVADQVALALENTRLVDEAQKNAIRNQVIANISARVRETLDVESVVRTATTELRRVFDLKETEISIGMPQIENTADEKQNESSK